MSMNWKQLRRVQLGIAAQIRAPVHPLWLRPMFAGFSHSFEFFRFPQQFYSLLAMPNCGKRRKRRTGFLP
jgi:hypothetical protein